MHLGPTPQAREERLWLAMCEAVRNLVPGHYPHSFVAEMFEGYRNDPASKKRWLTRFIRPKGNCPNLRLLEVAFAKDLLQLSQEKTDERTRQINGELSDALAGFVLSEHGINSRHFLRVPKLHGEDYRFRHPTRVFELMPFVTFSDDERDITDEHPGLLGQRRKGLYQGWFEGGAGRHRFMLLEKANEQTGSWDCVAVSIVLGLPDDVAAKFAEGSYKTVRGIGSEFTSDFNGRMTAQGDDVDCILVDTFIVRRLSSGSANRINHQGWSTALLFRHIANFTRENSDVHLFIEPAEPRLKILCDAYAFQRTDKRLWVKHCDMSSTTDQFTSSMRENVRELRSRYPVIEGEI